MAIPGESAAGIVLGVGAGAAASVALEPAIEVPRQQAWKNAPYRVLDPELLARLVAQGGIDLATAEADGLLEGFSADKVDALVYLAQTVPGVPEALTLWRRGLLSDALFQHVLVKAGLDQRYAAPLIQNKLAEPLGLGDIAYAVVRGILPTPSYVPVAPPTSGDKVPRYPQVQVDPEALAALIGYDAQALEIMVGRSGLSMAPGMAAQALFRNIIGPNDYLLAIAEGDLRTEWADTVLDVSRAIPTAGEFAELWLRGWLTQTEAEAGAARHGMTANDLDLLYKVRGRPITFHEITTGEARGGTPNSTYADIPEPYRTAAQQSDIRPEWASLHYANRYIYPSAFVLRTLAQSGDLGGQQAVEQVLLEIGWKPTFATQVSTAWTQGSATGDPHVAKAQTQLWNTTHRSYVANEVSAGAATTALEAAGVGAASVPAVLAVWNEEKALIRKQLTATQIKKAYTSQTTNPATGAAWTLQDAIARLLELGYDQADATTLLEE